MKKVLIPTDFSKNSKVALDYAINLFKDINCCFYILNTYDQIVASDHFDASLATSIKAIQVLKSNSEKELEKVKEQLEKRDTNKIHQYITLSQIGTLTSAVEELAKKEVIDVIIMGTKGITSSSNIVFGSNTIQVINKRNAPVIVVPSDYKFSPIKNVLFPTDLYINFTVKHLELIIEIVKQSKSNIILFHKIFRGLNALQRANKETLETYLTDVNSSFETVEDKEIDEAVYSYEKKHSVDLLVMINNKHSFLENIFFTPVVSKIVKQTEIPFLVIPS